MLQDVPMALLTNTRRETYLLCPKKHWYSFEQGLTRLRDPKPLRMGKAWHGALETLLLTGQLEPALADLYQLYEPLAGQTWAMLEHETLRQLLNGYYWQWHDMTLIVVEVELAFRLPYHVPPFELAGKMDAVVRDPDERLLLMEHKLLGEDIDPESHLWRRVALDGQVSLYTLAAQRLGLLVEGCIYDVCRKPTILPSKNGVEMTPEEWGEKLRADIGRRPDYYYQRRLTLRDPEELALFAGELQQVARGIEEDKAVGVHIRTVNKNTCPWCEFFPLCDQRWQPGDDLPEGYVVKESLHPKLEEA